MAQLEAALDAAGLLQAWVTPDGVHLASRDGSETVWPQLSGAMPAGTTLRAVLRPADDSAGLSGSAAASTSTASFLLELSTP